MKFSIRDLMWLMLVVALLIGQATTARRTEALKESLADESWRMDLIVRNWRPKWEALESRVVSANAAELQQLRNIALGHADQISALQGDVAQSHPEPNTPDVCP